MRRGKERQVLARLLLDAARLVPVEDLVATLWGSAPPATARQSLQNHVMRLRNMLGDGQRARIGTQPRGYLIRAEPSELDIARFEAAVAEARASVRAERWPAAAPAARAALALWRGDPLAGVDSELLAAREVPGLHELRLQAQEMALDADLHLGHAPDVIAGLRRLVAGHPLREP
ncbi:MAG TPA: BTAD domain-containing putative transcriptional regulator [Streptosporangiaceae bacterium]|nr:BTAD domain-containing putative transcriptional regulator [Streptosporangiaceae bacterium]